MATDKETLVERYAEEMALVAHYAQDTDGRFLSGGFEDVLRRFGKEVVEGCLPEEQPHDFKHGASTGCCYSFNACRSAMKEKVDELLK